MVFLTYLIKLMKLTAIAVKEEFLWQGQSKSKIQGNHFSTAKKHPYFVHFYKDNILFLELETAQTVACFSDNKKASHWHSNYKDTRMKLF